MPRAPEPEGIEYPPPPLAGEDRTDPGAHPNMTTDDEFEQVYKGATK